LPIRNRDYVGRDVSRNIPSLRFNDGQRRKGTGGTSGIGRASADKLAKLGIHVIVVGRNAERGERIVLEIRAAGGKADFISSDLRDASAARQVAKKAIEVGNNHVDILINGAGIYPFGPTYEMTEEMFDSVYSLNVKAPYFLVAELAHRWQREGKDPSSTYRQWLPIMGLRVRLFMVPAKQPSIC
jgi:NAD(P)-dependent dehydrogenase (short-subunit alcohol dehydrogenase family)